jgi:hypothetical protein
VAADDGDRVLSRDEDVEAHALRRRGWTVAAIARHLDRDPRTIKAHLDGSRVAGVRQRSVEDPFEPFVEYCRIRLAEDPHLWASVLREEIAGLGYAGGYSTFTRHCAVSGCGRSASRVRARARRMLR